MSTHIPERSCVGCRTRRARRELVRIVLPTGAPACVDRTGHADGRGAYVCAVTPLDCLEAARRRRALPRALRTTPERVDLDRLLTELAAAVPVGPSSAPEVLSSPL